MRTQSPAVPTATRSAPAPPEVGVGMETRGEGGGEEPTQREEKH
jgi:hypothetical protein